jgi:GNAT superfamily N-acetyltransferase
MKVECAIPSDSSFLGEAILMAERAHTGTGIWDIFIGEDDTLLAIRVLTSVVANAESSVYHYSRFLVARDLGNLPIASACGYLYPKFTISRTYDQLGHALQSERGWSSVDLQLAISRMDFLEESFPSDIDWNTSGVWMIEAVFVSPSYRGRGIASAILTAVRDQGRSTGVDKCWITCAIGNDSASSVYKKLGFQEIGSIPHNQDCLDKIYCPGFRVYEYTYTYA